MAESAKKDNAASDKIRIVRIIFLLAGFIVFYSGLFAAVSASITPLC